MEECKITVAWRGPAYVFRSQGIRNAYWQEISFGDGFDVYQITIIAGMGGL